MEEPVDRAELAARVDSSFESLTKLLDTADPDVLDRPGTVGDWSGRDLVAHMVWWQEEFLSVSAALKDGTHQRKDYSDTHAVNAAAVKALGGESANDLVQRLRENNRRISSEVTSFPPELWAAKPRLPQFVSGVTIDHYTEHEKDLRKLLGGAG